MAKVHRYEMAFVQCGVVQWVRAQSVMYEIAVSVNNSVNEYAFERNCLTKAKVVVWPSQIWHGQAAHLAFVRQTGLKGCSFNLHDMVKKPCPKQHFC